MQEHKRVRGRKETGQEGAGDGGIRGALNTTLNLIFFNRTGLFASFPKLETVMLSPCVLQALPRSHDDRRAALFV